MEKKLLLIISHPDDEAMFFIPSIVHLMSMKLKSESFSQFYVLCLSSGNAYGLGNMRIHELSESLEQIYNQIYGKEYTEINMHKGKKYTRKKVENVSLQVDRGNTFPKRQKQTIPDKASKNFKKDVNVVVVDQKDLQDNLNLQWDTCKVAGLVEKYVKLWNIDTLLTFDKLGVSGHPNHRSTYNGVKYFYDQFCKQHMEEKQCECCLRFYTLMSHSLIRKYIGIGEYLLSFILASIQNIHFLVSKLFPKTGKERSTLKHSPNPITQTKFRGQEFLYCFNWNPFLVYQCMKAHRSQLIWYRYLFIVFSSYTYVNILQNRSKEDDDNLSVKKRG